MCHYTMYMKHLIETYTHHTTPHHTTPIHRVYTYTVYTCTDKPTGLVVSNVGGHSLELQWNAIMSRTRVDQYVLEYGAQDNPSSKVRCYECRASEISQLLQTCMVVKDLAYHHSQTPPPHHIPSTMPTSSIIASRSTNFSPPLPPSLPPSLPLPLSLSLSLSLHRM